MGWCNNRVMLWCSTGTTSSLSGLTFLVVDVIQMCVNLCFYENEPAHPCCVDVIMEKLLSFYSSEKLIWSLVRRVRLFLFLLSSTRDPFYCSSTKSSPLLWETDPSRRAACRSGDWVWGGETHKDTFISSARVLEYVYATAKKSY